MKSNKIIGATFPKIRYAIMSKIKLPTHPFKPELFLYADGNGILTLNNLIRNNSRCTFRGYRLFQKKNKTKKKTQ